jgi:hypothetical protein
MGKVDGTEQGCPSLVEAKGGLTIADGIGKGIELLAADSGFEATGGVREEFELLGGVLHRLVGVALAQPALGVDRRGGEEAGMMAVEIGRQHPLGEVIALRGEASRYVVVAEVLVDDRAVLTLGQGVDVGAARA